MVVRKTTSQVLSEYEEDKAGLFAAAKNKVLLCGIREER